MIDQPARAVVRCSRIGEDGPCGREQTVSSTAEVSDAVAEWFSFGWRCVDGGRWLCPACAANAGLSEGLP